MGVGWRLFILLVVLHALSGPEHTRIKQSVKPRPPGFDAASLIQQNEDHFAYRVLADALDRSAGGNQLLDTLFFALMASVAAIYAITLDKLSDYPPAVMWLLLGAFVLSIGGTLLSVAAEDAPNPRAFAETFPKMPAETRRIYQARYITLAERNDNLRRIKLWVLVFALAATVIALVIATDARLNGSKEAPYGQGRHQRVSRSESCDSERTRALAAIGLWLPSCIVQRR